MTRRILARQAREAHVPDRLDPSQHPVQVDVPGRPLVLERTLADDTGRFVSPTTRIAGRDRGSAIGAGLIAVFLVVALVKPWSAPDDDPGPRPVGRADAGVAQTPAPTPDLSDLRAHCQEPLGWRVYSRENWSGQAVRAWRSVEPVVLADGPLDPRIPVVQLGSGIEALGYCSPWTGAERPPAGATVAAWRLAPTRRGGDPFEALILETIDPQRPTVLGALYGGLPGTPSGSSPGPVGAGAGSDRPAGWPAGRFVFRVVGPDWERWWAVDVAEPRLPLHAPSDRPMPPTGPTLAPTGSATP